MRTPFLAVLITGLLPFSAWAQSGANDCDLTHDGTVDFADVNAAVNMALGVTPCTANVQGSGVCNAVVVQKVVNVALGGACASGNSGNSHSVLLNWTASITPNVVGYNVYRSNQIGGPFVKINLSLVGLTQYTDLTVLPGVTFYYVVTAVDSKNNESDFSTPATPAVIPKP